LYSNTSGGANSAFGQGALQNNTTAGNNTAVGYQAGYTNTTGSVNTALGYQAGYSNTTGAASTFIGSTAGYSTTTANYNTFIGREAGYSNTTGGFNTFVGQASGYYVTTGTKNTIIGQYTGNQGGLDIRTSSNYIVLSDGDGTPRIVANSSSGYGSNSPQAWVEASLLWGTSGASGYTSGGKAISADNSSNTTIRAEIVTATNEWQPHLVFVRCSSTNADATGGLAAWWLMFFRAYNGSAANFGVYDSGGSTGTLTLTGSDATSGTTAKALVQFRVTGGSNRTVMDVEIISYNEMLTITRT